MILVWPLPIHEVFFRRKCFVVFFSVVSIILLMTRYLLQQPYVADGSSSKFAEGNRWGYFPSAAAAWRVSEEILER